MKYLTTGYKEFIMVMQKRSKIRNY